MKLRTSALLFACVSILGVACANRTTTTSPNSNTTKPASSAAATPDPLAEARGLFAKNCQTCHQPDGKGGPVKLDDGTRLRVPSLREGHALRHPDSDFRKQIEKGGDGMPAFKDKLSAQQIDGLIHFIRQEFEGGITPPAEKAVSGKH
jgi:mono/diheme cytochrome c family protein